MYFENPDRANMTRLFAAGADEKDGRCERRGAGGHGTPGHDAQLPKSPPRAKKRRVSELEDVLARVHLPSRSTACVRL